MKEWTYDEALKVITTVLIENTNEDQLSDDDAAKLAIKIADALEKA